MSNHSFSEEILPTVHPEPPLVQLNTVSSHPGTGCLGEETNPYLPTTSFQLVVESDNKVTPEPPLLQASSPWNTLHNSFYLEVTYHILDGEFSFLKL